MLNINTPRRVSLKEHKSKRGMVVVGEEEFVDNFVLIEQKDESDRNKWISWLRKFNIKASHPNDGWNKREENYISFSYPHFNDGVEEGDLIAMGDYDGFVVVVVDRIHKTLFGNRKYYYRDYK